MPLIFKFIVIIILGGLLQSPSFAQQEEVSVGRIRYIIQEGDTLEGIFSRFLKDGRSLKKDGEFYRLNIERNWQIKDWEDLGDDYIGDEMDVYLPAVYIDKKKFKDYLKLKETIANEKGLQKIADSLWMNSIFYMASYGRFNQTQSVIDIKFQQNSPFTLGYATSYKFSPKWRWSASAYLSYLMPADSVLATEKVSIRPEVGFNTYLGHNFEKFSLYGGVDFERFTTFNIDTLIADSTVARDELRIFFATIGIDKYFRANRQGLLLRASLSSAITTARTSYAGETLENPFTGMKLLLYANTPIGQKYFIHFLYKQHMMSGPGDLNVSRIGFGFGYKL